MWDLVGCWDGLLCHRPGAEQAPGSTVALQRCGVQGSSLHLRTNTETHEQPWWACSCRLLQIRMIILLALCGRVSTHKLIYPRWLLKRPSWLRREALGRSSALPCPQGSDMALTGFLRQNLAKQAGIRGWDLA